MQGIYTSIPETNYVPREYSVAAILLLPFMVIITIIIIIIIICDMTLDENHHDKLLQWMNYVL